MPVTCYSLKFYILAFLSVQTLCILGAHLGSLQSSVYCSACSWWNCSRIEWLLLLPLRRHMSILSCVILFKSSTMNPLFIHQLCVHRDMKHLRSLESTQEARVALGYASSNSYATFVLSKRPACFMNDRNQWSYILSVTVEVHFIASSGDINPRQ